MHVNTELFEMDDAMPKTTNDCDPLMMVRPLTAALIMKFDVFAAGFVVKYMFAPPFSEMG